MDFYGDKISDDVMVLFPIFDKDGSGEIEKKEMVNFLISLLESDETVPTIQDES